MTSKTPQRRERRLKLVTKEYLLRELQTRPELIVGRALIAIFNRQTTEERSQGVTRFNNGVGFTGTDARIGTLTAKAFLKNGKLEDWQLRNWLAPNRKGEPRIVKYVEQLNDIAIAKLASSNGQQVSSFVEKKNDFTAMIVNHG